MSKGNMLLGHARGKVGSLVFSRSNGKQIVRAKADVVRNPQTQAQMIQRILLNTVAQAYSKMSPIVDHSFEGLNKGQECMSYFMKKNLKALREYVAQQIASGATMEEIFEFSPLGTDIFVANNYVIAKGQLPKVAVLDDNADATMKIALGTNTYQGVLDAYGLQRGDQLTFVGIQEDASGDLEFKYVRVILDPRETNGGEAPLSTAFVTVNAITKPNDRNEGSFGTLTFASDAVSFGFGSSFLRAAAVIVSRKNEDDTWMRSDAKLVFNTSSSEQTYSLQYCLDAFVNGGITLESKRYLNNAGVGTAVATPTQAFTASRVKIANGWKNVPLNNEQYLGVMGLAIQQIEGTGDLDDTYTIKLFEGASQVGTDMTVAVDGTVSNGSISEPATEKTYTVKLYKGEALKQTLGTIVVGPDDAD